MATKVKGDKIKEGSIPLSALADDVKGEFDGKYGYMNCKGVLNIYNDIIYAPVDVYYIFSTARNKSILLNPGESKNLNSMGGSSIIITSEMYEGNKVKISINNTSSVGSYGNLYVYKDYKSPTIPTPDWNAQEGEKGYIENKPFEKIIFDGIIESDNTIVYDYNISTSAIYISCENKEILHFINVGGNKEATLDWPNIKISWNGADQIIITNLSDESIDAIKNYISIYAYEYDIRLPSSSIDDGVIKTFPQTLSTNDKSQALANLGIDHIINIDELIDESGNNYDEELDAGTVSKSTIKRVLAKYFYRNSIKLYGFPILYDTVSEGVYLQVKCMKFDFNNNELDSLIAGTEGDVITSSVTISIAKNSDNDYTFKYSVI